MNITNGSFYRIEDLQCTDKAFEQVQSYTSSNDLSGRERQCLFLMMRNDELSLVALNKFIEKVDINSLIKRGYLQANDGVALNATDGQVLKDSRKASDTMNDSAPVLSSNVHPGVALLSGNVF